MKIFNTHFFINDNFKTTKRQIDGVTEIQFLGLLILINL